MNFIVNMFKKYHLREYDFLLCLMLMAITIIGILVVGSAQADLQSKQLLGFIAGFSIMIVISLIDYHIVIKFNWIIYAINLVLLLLVIIKGETTGGAQRWVSLFGIRFQPSETSKILLILFFAQFILKAKEKIKDFRMILLLVVLTGIPLFMVYKQPDLSTTIVLTFIFLVTLFVAEIPYKYVIGFLAIVVPVFVIGFILLIQPNSFLVEKDIIEQYQQTRVLAWLHPEEYTTTEAFQQLNSIMAIGSGQLYGKGLNNNVVNSVKNGNFISEPQTDFIYTIVGEELGFIGSATVVILLIAIAIDCIIIAYRSNDIAGRIIAAGVAAHIGFQTFFNISVTTGLLPNTGLPLPFVSAGLTSLITLYAAMGFVLNVRLQIDKKNK